MTYFQDLSIYSYRRCSLVTQDLNVGWLDKEHEFTQGQCPSEVVDNLLEQLQQGKVYNLCRGFHRCNICDSQGKLIHRYEYKGYQFVGNGEFHVRISASQFYVAPVLILHYIIEHNYLPPEDFIKAVQAKRFK